MQHFKKLWFAVFLVTVIPVFAQKNIRLKSPDGNIVFSFKLTEKAPVYQVKYKGRKLIDDSKLSFSFKEDGDFESNLKMLKPQFKNVDETYDLIVGKTKNVRDQYKEVIIPLIESNGAKRQINLIVRAFNDGLAFRYEFPEQQNWKSYTMTNENSTFNIMENPMVCTLLFKDSHNTHEDLYHKLHLNEIKEDTLMDLPALFEFPGKIYMAITEADLRNYAGMYLMKHNGILKTELSTAAESNRSKGKSNTAASYTLAGDDDKRPGRSVT